jgi:predicted metal-dependent hydrolase
MKEPRIEEVRAEARYHRERYDLYKAKVYGPRETSMSRLQELERVYLGAESRLRKAEQALNDARRDASSPA